MTAQQSIDAALDQVMLAIESAAAGVNAISSAGPSAGCPSSEPPAARAISPRSPAPPPRWPHWSQR
jgi:hypothetical protein